MTVLAVILGVIVVIYPIFLLGAVKFGMKMVDRPEEIASEPILEDIFPKVRTKKREITDEERKMAMIYENIENYVGDSTNQQEVI